MKEIFGLVAVIALAFGFAYYKWVPQTRIVEKVVEKPIIKERIVEKPVEKVVEKPVYLERPKPKSRPYHPTHPTYGGHDLYIIEDNGKTAIYGCRHCNQTFRHTLED
jgi:hypothetical protein